MGVLGRAREKRETERLRRETEYGERDTTTHNEAKPYTLQRGRVRMPRNDAI